MKVGTASDMNRRNRRTMEDAHQFKLDFPQSGMGFFGIYDGHAGKTAALWCQDNLHSLFERNYRSRIQEAVVEKRSLLDVLERTFLDTNGELGKKNGITSGCTAVVAFIEPGQDTRRTLYCANVGDARAVLCRSGRAIRLSYDHKGNDPQEIKRIIEAGGFIMNSRVNGVLAVTRALGDESMKDLVISSPYCAEIELLDEQDQFLILACDGIWDVVSDQEAVELVMTCRDDPQKTADLLLRHAIDSQATDNITVMVIVL